MGFRVNSIGSALPSLGVSRSIASVPLRVRCASLSVCLPASSMMSCRHRIRFRSCLPSRDTRPVIRLSCGLASPAYPLSRITSPFLSLCLASPHAPSLVSAGGAMSCCGRVRFAFLVRAIWYQVGGGGSVLLASYRRRCRCDASIAGAWFPRLGHGPPVRRTMWHVPPLCLLARLVPFPHPSLPISPCCLLPAVSPFAPFSRVDRRGVISACTVSRLHRLLSRGCVYVCSIS